MTTKFKNFQEFYEMCDKLYTMYEPHFFLQGCEIITNFKGNEIDNGCWYCIVKLREHVHTILAYDHGADSADKPFVVYCDWSQQDDYGFKYGDFTECKDFGNIEEAFYFMVYTPSKYHIRPEEDMVLISEKDDNETIIDFSMGLGLLDAIKRINSDNFYKGKTIQIYQPKSYGRTVLYQRQIQ